MTGALACLGLALCVAAWLAWELECERRAHGRTRAALDAYKATVAAAEVLYGRDRMREAARGVTMREKAD